MRLLPYFKINQTAFAMTIFRFSYLVLILFWVGCSSSESTEEPLVELARGTYQEPSNWVDTARVVRGTFQRELLSNGKLSASRKAELSFQQEGIIAKVAVRNGQRVKKGQLIAKLDDTQARQEKQRAAARLAQAELDRRDALISVGYLQTDSSKIPDEVLTLAALQSGYRQAQLDLESAIYQLSLTEIRAPFAGTVANLGAQAYQSSQDHRPLCLLQDLRPMLVRFSILETELDLLNSGNTLQIEPLAQAGESYPARLESVNPRVNKNGLVEVFAKMERPSSQLLPGMNVRVRLRQGVADQLIVPKEAVVLRQGRPVVFVYRNDTAFWHYVKPALENSEKYSLSEGLEANEIVITSGNLNLAHMARVKVQ